MTEALAIAGRSAELYMLVESLAKDVVAGQFEQEKRFAQLASALIEIQAGSYWKNWGFNSYGKYIIHLSGVVGKERSTLYGYAAVAERLLPVIGQEKLELLGINKCLVLSSGMKLTGRIPSVDLIDKAADPKVTAKELEAAVNTEFKLFLPEGDGKWRSLGFYADDSEWGEIQQAIEVAKREDPPISSTLPDHSQLKESLLRLAQEFVSTYGGDRA